MTTMYDFTVIAPQNQQVNLPRSTMPFGSYSLGDSFLWQNVWFQISHVSHIVLVDAQQDILVRTAVNLAVAQQQAPNTWQH